jgi:hypothetical protein
MSMNLFQLETPGRSTAVKNQPPSGNFTGLLRFERPASAAVGVADDSGDPPGDLLAG